MLKWGKMRWERVGLGLGIPPLHICPPNFHMPGWLVECWLLAFGSNAPGNGGRYPGELFSTVGVVGFWCLVTLLEDCRAAEPERSRAGLSGNGLWQQGAPALEARSVYDPRCLSTEKQTTRHAVRLHGGCPSYRYEAGAQHLDSLGCSQRVAFRVALVSLPGSPEHQP